MTGYIALVADSCNIRTWKCSGICRFDTTVLLRFRSTRMLDGLWMANPCWILCNLMADRVAAWGLICTIPKEMNTSHIIGDGPSNRVQVGLI